MSWQTALISRVLFPLQERLKGHNTLEVLRSMEQTQWLSANAVAALQASKLQAFMTRLERSVPYWRETLRNHGLSANQLCGPDDLARLPLLDKPTIRAHTGALVADDAQHLARFSTGGSSGEPLTFFLDRERVSHDVAAKLRATHWWGVDIGDPEIVVWGSPIELGAQDRIRRLRDSLMRTELLSAFEMSEPNLARFVQRIRNRRPRMLFGYPSSLAAIANFARENNVRLDGLGVRVAFVTSERLYDHQRTLIRETFGCPVANGYGGRDAGFIAHECPEGSLHVTAEDIIVEIVDREGQVVPAGTTGEVVVTHLHSGAFPFVRYRTGDVGALGDTACSCGRGLPVLERLEGRTTDFVVARDGTLLHGLSLIYVLRDIATVREFRIVQETLDDVVVELVPAEGFGEDEESQIVAQFRARLGAEVRVILRRVDAIAPERSGKFRYVVSRVPGAAIAEAETPHGNVASR